MRKRKRLLAWAVAAAMTLILFLIVSTLLDWRYAQNDDTAIMRSFMGYETGTPVSFSIFIHGLLAWPLFWLSTAFPGIAWFSVVQIALIALALTIISKSVMQCFVNQDRSMLPGAALALAFLAAYGLRLATHITFTQTAALLGAAAVLQVLSVDYKNEGNAAVARGVLAALIPASLAYALRSESFWPVLAFSGLALFSVLVIDYLPDPKMRGRLKPFLATGLAAAVVMAGLMGWRQAEIAVRADPDYLEWQNVRARVLDYYDLRQLSEEELAKAGWSENTLLLAEKFCFLDKDISVDSLLSLEEAFLAAEDHSFSGEMEKAASSIRNLYAEETSFRPSLYLALGLWAAALLMACFLPKGRAGVIVSLALGAALFVVMMLYLSVKGRFPLRAVLTGLLPLVAMALALLPRCLPKGRGCALLLAICALCVSGVAVASELPTLILDEAAAEEIGDPAAALDEYALCEPDMLFIYDMTLAIDTRLFPDVSEGIPHNVVFWGGWGMRSPESVEQFKAFDIDILNFDPETLLRDDVCLATGMVDPPPELILDYLHEKVSPDVDFMLYGEDAGVYYFQFY